MQKLALAQSIKEKYPMYANIPDADLERMVVSKYKQYEPMAGKTQKKTIGGFFKNLRKSASNLIGGTLNALIDLPGTVKNLGGLVSDTGAFIAGDRNQNNKAIQLGTFYKDRYGGLDKIGDTLYEDPVGTAMDASMVLGGTGAVIGGVGKLERAGQIANVGKNISRAAQVIDPITGVTKLGGKAFSPLTKFGGKEKIAQGLDGLSDSLVTRGLGNPAEQAKLTQKYGGSMRDFIDKYKLYDRSAESAANVKQQILSNYDDIALRSGKNIQLGKIIKSIDDEIAKLSTNGSQFSTSGQAQIKELARRRDQIIQSAGGSQALPPVRISAENLTNFRRKALDPDIPKSMFNLDPHGSGTALGAKAARDIVRKNLNSIDPNLEQLGMDYGMAKGVENIFKKAESRASNRQLLNFTKLGTSGVGGMMAGLPGAIAGFAAEHVVNHPRFLSATSKLANKSANVVRTAKPMSINPKLAMTTNVFSKAIINTGKVGRSINPGRTSQSSNQYLTTSVPKIKENTQEQTSVLLPNTSTFSTQKTKYKLPKIKSTKVGTGAAFNKVGYVGKGSFY